MRLLLDENMPVEFAQELVGHQADTVVGVGWAGVKNGELLRRAAGRYDAFLTMDRNLEHQQNVAALPFAVVVVRAPSNRMVHLRPLADDVLKAIALAKPGVVQRVGG
jgi:hypothetical protein